MKKLICKYFPRHDRLDELAHGSDSDSDEIHTEVEILTLQNTEKCTFLEQDGEYVYFLGEEKAGSLAFSYDQFRECVTVKYLVVAERFMSQTGYKAAHGRDKPDDKRIPLELNIGEKLIVAILRNVKATKRNLSLKALDSAKGFYHKIFSRNLYQYNESKATTTTFFLERDVTTSLKRKRLFHQPRVTEYFVPKKSRP